MSLDTRRITKWIDLGTLNAKVVFDVRGFVQASISVTTPNGLGTAVLKVRASYDGGVTGIDYSPAKTLTITDPAEEFNIYAVDTLIVQVTTAGTANENAQVTLFATADPGQGVVR